jgi:hypothetical protein
MEAAYLVVLIGTFLAIAALSLYAARRIVGGNR